jgi:CHAT domain-containing protein
LPWSALVDRKTNQYLVQKYAVANSIGLSLTAPRPIAGIQPRVLAAGFAAETTDPDTGRKFEALQTVDEELDALQARFPGAVRRLPGALSHAALRRALDDDPYTIVHLATHAKFRASLRDTFLLAADGKITLDNLSALIKPVRTGGQPIELLSLSACETAAGNDRASLGLAGVALKAGARSVTASLWPINDRATPMFFDGFYDALATRKLSKAKAVQQAQLSLLKGNVPAFAHPHYWAPFVVIGNWQ